MKNPLRYLFLLVLLIITLIASLVFWPWFQAYLVQPLAILLWAILRVFLSIHQKIYWSVLIVLTITLAVLALPPQKKEDIWPYQRKQKPEDRVRHWREILRYSARAERKNMVTEELLQELWRTCLNEKDSQDMPPLEINSFSPSKNKCLLKVTRHLSDRQYYNSVDRILNDIETKMEIKTDDQ